jgi:hypothetical protein
VTGGSTSIYLGYHTDLNKREFVICFLFLLFIVGLGIYPSFILNDIQLDISSLILDLSLPLNTPSSFKDGTVFFYCSLYCLSFYYLLYLFLSFGSKNF